MATEVCDPVADWAALLRRPDEVADDARRGYRVTAPSTLRAAQVVRLKRDLARAYVAHRLSETRPLGDPPRLIATPWRRRRPVVIWRRKEGVA